MSAVATKIGPNALLRDTLDGSVLSFRYRVCDAANADALDLSDTETYEAVLGEMLQQVSDGDLEVVDGVEPDMPTCRECGCTEEYACEDPLTGKPCSWTFFTASTNRLLCTGCGARSAS